MPSDSQHNPNDLIKVWPIVLLSIAISIYFIIELLTLVLNMIIFVAFKVVLPIIGVYIIMNVFKLGRFLPRLSDHHITSGHRILMRTFSWSDKMTTLLNTTFDAYSTKEEE